MITHKDFTIESFIANRYIKGISMPYDKFYPEAPMQHLTSIHNEELMKHVEWEDDWLAGVILIKYFDQVLLGFQHKDCIIDNWFGLIGLINKYIENNGSHSGLMGWDQGFKIELERINNGILKYGTVANDSTKNINAQLPVRDFFTALIKGAEEFFPIMLAHTFSKTDPIELCNDTKKTMEDYFLRMGI